MRAIVCEKFGEPDVLQLVERPLPQPSKGEVRVRIKAAGVNRADIVQRRGSYAPPADAPPDILGLEFAGEIDAVGDAVTDWKKGDRVYGLAGGGTYAQFLVVHSRTIAAIPQNLSFIEAAAIPEAFLTAYDAIVFQGGLSAGETLLISAVGSGVGTAAVQIARAIGAVSVGTARTERKLNEAKELGLNHGILVQEGNFAQNVLQYCPAGIDVILELVGGPYVAEDLRCIASKGRIIVVGLMAGATCQSDLGLLMRKRAIIRGTTMRLRPLEEKISAGQALAKHLSPLFLSQNLKPIVAKVFPLNQAVDAHKFMEGNENFGKIILEV